MSENGNPDDRDTGNPGASARARAADWRPVFLAAFAKSGIIRRAAEAAGVNRCTVAEHRQKDPDFAAAYQEALEDSNDRIREEIRRRAYGGTLRPVFYRGVQCGEIREFSDTLAIAFAKSRMPEFREKHELTGADGRDLLSILAGVVADPVSDDGDD